MITPRSFIHARKSSPSSIQSRRSTSRPEPSAIQSRPLPLGKNVIPASRLLASEQPHSDVIVHSATSATVSRGVLPRPDYLSETDNPPSTTMTTTATQPITPSSAVQIPIKQRHHSLKSANRARSSSARRARDVHSPDAVPPAVAALLAITNIPPPKRRKSVRQKEIKDRRMTVDSIVPRSRVSEKDLSQELHWDLDDESSLASFERSPLEFLLTPPDELEEEDALLHTDSGFASPFSTRTGSFDSLPSLGDSVSPSATASADSPVTPRGGRLRSPRRSLQPVTTPPGEQPRDPLSKLCLENERLDFSAKPSMVTNKQTQTPTPFKSVFKSNLTASLRALRSAARSLSTFTSSSIPPDDFLTRSILTIDPRVPFTDERRPPVLEEEPSEAMRRYLNPSSNVRLEARGSSPIRGYTASIQMQTYKVQRSRGVPKAARQAAQASNSNKASTVVLLPLGPRQREMRENPDFIRIAVMEHLMRKNGKLDDQREGHARWLLPPRKATTKPYEIGPGGVPVRWTPMLQDD
ncbi:hypothetical protein SAMD00023353_2601300 [Rosellinia necatrix]|uniref:Uncharacterized protein n=1 Tax=Rosellinia necatrix TaxID=77044 RepID=A0A1W2TH31_ROSNE|nr:hypothetical protein SAMD00023353_2601300 [Rosellinia necatrix]